MYKVASNRVNNVNKLSHCISNDLISLKPSYPSIAKVIHSKRSTWVVMGL